MALICFLISRASSVLALQIFASVFVFRTVAIGAGVAGLAKLGLVATLGSIVFAWPIGRLVDHLHKRTAILSSQALMLSVALAVVLTNPTQMRALLGATVALAIARNYRSISQFTVFGELLADKSNKSRLINLSTLSWQLSMFVSPLIAGVLGVGRPPLVLALGCVVLSVGCQVSIVRFLKPRALLTRALPQERGELIAFFKGNDKIRSSLLLDFVVVVFAGASSLLPFLHPAHGSPLDIGILRSAVPAGVILGTFLRLHKTSIERWAELLLVATIGYGGCHLLLAESRYFALSYALLVGAGVFDALSLSVREGLLQLETPPALKGRVYALNSFLVNASDELSEWESGSVAGWLGIRGTLRASGAVALIASGVFWARNEHNATHLRYNSPGEKTLGTA